MSKLPPDTRSSLQTVANSVALMDAKARKNFEAIGQRISDQLRSKMPDIDDVTMGRVIFATNIYLVQLLEQEDLGPVTNILTMVTLELTAAERINDGRKNND